MRAALADKLIRDEEEVRVRDEQVSLKEGYNAVVSTWKSRHKVREERRCETPASFWDDFEGVYTVVIVPRKQCPF